MFGRFIEKQWKPISLGVGLLTVLATLVSPLGPKLWEEMRGKAIPEKAADGAEPTSVEPPPVDLPPPQESDSDPPSGTTQGGHTVKRPPVAPQPQATLSAAKYLNPAITNREKVKEAAILILDEKRQSQVQMEQAIANLLAQQGAQPIQSLFTSAFVQEGHARALFDGQWQIAQDLELNTRIDNLILGFARVSYSKNPEYQGLLTANLLLELKCFDFQLQRICGTKSLSVTGAGYTQQKALETAVRGIVPQLEVYVRDSF